MNREPDNLSIHKIVSRKNPTFRSLLKLLSGKGIKKQGLALLPWWGKADDLALAFITLARIQLAQASRSKAIETIKKAIQLIQSRGIFSEARSVVEAAQVKSWLVQGDLSSLDRWAYTFEKRFGLHDPFRFEDELTHITQARVFIARNQQDGAIRLLSRLEESARRWKAG